MMHVEANWIESVFPKTYERVDTSFRMAVNPDNADEARPLFDLGLLVSFDLVVVYLQTFIHQNQCHLWSTVFPCT